MRGVIVRGVGGFYYVAASDGKTYECRARGIFRKEKRKPLVGDRVEMSVTDPKDLEGSLDEIMPRKNELVRPAAANIDQVLVVFAAADPQPNLHLLDRFLACMRRQNLPVLVLLNKEDLVEEKEVAAIKEIYKDSGSKVMSASVARGTHLEEVRALLTGKTTIVAGPSGVGKSSLTNYLNPQADREVGEISRKIRRGKQTTRHTQLVCIGPDTFFLDTPGFATIDLVPLTERDLPLLYPEFLGRMEQCRFQGCLHLSEPDCAVKRAVAQGEIAKSRYDNYVLMEKELKELRRY